MPKYIIRAVYEYENNSPIEATNEQSAEQLFLADLNQYYKSTEELEITQVCDECEEEEDSCFCDEEEEA